MTNKGCHVMSCHGVNELCFTSKICLFFCLFFSRSFISYALLSFWLPYHWAIGLNTFISKNSCCPEIQNPLVAISRRASSVISAVLSWRDSPFSCWSVGSINTSWHMISRRFAVRSYIWLWHGLIKSPFLEERTWSMVKQAPHSQVAVCRCSCHPYHSRSRSKKQFLLIV